MSKIDHGGPDTVATFLVHASSNIDREVCRELGIDPAKLQTGGVVGIAEITDCVEDHRSKWFEGPYGFVLRHRKPLPFVLWKGALGLRDAPLRLLKRLGLEDCLEHPLS